MHSLLTLLVAFARTLTPRPHDNYSSSDEEGEGNYLAIMVDWNRRAKELQREAKLEKKHKTSSSSDIEIIHKRGKVNVTKEWYVENMGYPPPTEVIVPTSSNDASTSSPAVSAPACANLVFTVPFISSSSSSTRDLYPPVNPSLILLLPCVMN